MATIRDVLTRLRRDGWLVVRRRGSHRQLQHPLKPGTVTVAGHPRDSVRPGTYRAIMKQARMKDTS